MLDLKQKMNLRRVNDKKKSINIIFYTRIIYFWHQIILIIEMAKNPLVIFLSPVLFC